MNDQLDNPLVPLRFEVLTFWGIVIGVFIGWSLFCGFCGYLMAPGS